METKFFIEANCSMYETKIFDSVLFDDKGIYRAKVLSLLSQKVEDENIREIKVQELWSNKGYVFSLLIDSEFEIFKSELCTGDFIKVSPQNSFRTVSMKRYFFEKDYENCETLTNSISKEGFVMLSKISCNEEKVSINVIRMNLF